MSENILFSSFPQDEFEKLTQLLCNIFKTNMGELAYFYQQIKETYDIQGWPPHFIENRDFFSSSDNRFQFIYNESPSIAVDLPSTFEIDNGVFDKKTVVILGQDSKSDQETSKIHLGTPFGLHHQASRETLARTKVYFDMICVLISRGYRVYLTDVYKIWVCDPKRPFNGIKLPLADREKFSGILKAELLNLNPVAIITWGQPAANHVKNLDLQKILSSDIEHLSFPHPSGAANGKWREVLSGEKATNENKVRYFDSVISERLPSSCNANA